MQVITLILALMVILTSAAEELRVGDVSVSRGENVDIDVSVSVWRSGAIDYDFDLINGTQQHFSMSLLTGSGKTRYDWVESLDRFKTYTPRDGQDINWLNLQGFASAKIAKVWYIRDKNGAPVHSGDLKYSPYRIEILLTNGDQVWLLSIHRKDEDLGQYTEINDILGHLVLRPAQAPADD